MIGIISTFYILIRKPPFGVVISNKIFSENAEQVLSTLTENEKQLSNINLKNVIEVRNLFIGSDSKLGNIIQEESGLKSNFVASIKCSFTSANEPRTFVFECRENAVDGKITVDDWLRTLMVHKACIGLTSATRDSYDARLAQVAMDVTPKLKKLGVTGLQLGNGDMVIDNVDGIPKWANDRLAQKGQ